LTSISFVTWNVALLRCSEQAPPTFTQVDVMRGVRDALASADADVVALQEVPVRERVPDLETHRVVSAMTASHSGLVVTLVRKELAATGQMTVTVGEGHAVMVTLPGGLTVANVHLAPGRSSADVRYAMLAAVVEHAPSKDLLIIGDTNTTVAEVRALASLGLHGHRPPSFTVDWRRNRFHPDLGGRPRITTYYTRWFASGAVTVSDVKVWNEPIHHRGSSGFHLSDHFALSGRAHMATAPPA
jgi:endonuclease/exonuclease/phosphatase family metal-dependent hydrolase